MPKVSALSLKEVVTTYQCPIDEEQAWALIFMGLKKMLVVTQETREGKCYLVKRLEDLILDVDGTIHEDSFVKKGDLEERDEMTNLGLGIAELTVVIYDALDWEIGQGNQRRLNDDLENLITRIVSLDDSEEEDEGIEICEDEVAVTMCEEVFRTTKKHFLRTGTADEAHCYSHYKQVCQEMVNEVYAMTASKRMGLTNTEPELEPNKAENNQWIGVYSQVIDELMSGDLKRNLKTSSPVEKKTEFPMLPFEEMMADIKNGIGRRSLRSSSRRIIPKLVDPGEKIMNYIKSRPKLKPASERKLAELILEETPGEKLLSDIRSGHGRRSLRSTHKERKRLNKTSPRPFSKDRDVGGSGRKKDKKALLLDDAQQSFLVNFDSSSEDNSGDESVFEPPSLEERISFPIPMQGVNERCGQPLVNTVPMAEESLTLLEYGVSRNQMVLGTIDLMDKFSDKELLEFKAGKVCTQCQETKFNWFRRPNCCHVCQHKVCNDCCTKIKFPNTNRDQLMLSSLTIERREDNSKPRNKFGFTRGSLKVPLSRQEEPRLRRSKTLSKADAKALEVKVVNLSEKTSTNVMSYKSVCLDCNSCLDGDILYRGSRGSMASSSGSN